MADLEKIGEKCKRLLLAIGQGFTSTEIVQKFGYASRGSVKVMRHRCVKRFLEHGELRMED